MKHTVGVQRGSLKRGEEEMCKEEEVCREEVCREKVCREEECREEVCRKEKCAESLQSGDAGIHGDILSIGDRRETGRGGCWRHK